MKMKPGRMAAVPSAEMKPHSDPVDVTNVVILTGTVRMIVVRKSDSRNSGQEKRRHRTAAAATPPRTIGSTTLQKVCQRVAPSIIAASSTSLGTSSKKELNKSNRN